MLRNNHQAIYVPIVKKQTSPIFATILSLLCPGLGAAYNGQTSKALVHFVAFIGLFQMAIATMGSPFFVLGFLGIWVYAALDAWRTAQAIRVGVTPTAAEDALVNRFAGNPKLWGIVLSAIGISFVLQTLFDFNWLLSRFVLPVLLLGLGVYLLLGFFKSKDGVATAGEGNQAKFDESGRAMSDEYFDAEFFESSDQARQNHGRAWKNR